MTMRVVSPLVTATAVGLLVITPLIVLQLRYRSGPDVPVALFVVLWILPTAFVLAATPLRHAWRAGHPPAAFVARLALLVVIASAWIAVVHDQLPCFFGVQDCDCSAALRTAARVRRSPASSAAATPRPAGRLAASAHAMCNR